MCHVRRRLGAKELKAKTKQPFFAREHFSEMPPQETIKSLEPFLDTEGIAGPEEQLEEYSTSLVRISSQQKDKELKEKERKSDKEKH